MLVESEASYTSEVQYFGFFSRHPPRLIGAHLPSTDGEEDEMALAHAQIRVSEQNRDV